MSTALALAVPIGLAGLGGLWAERAGVVNIGLEGMMILGTWFGAWAGYQWGPWTGVLVGIIGGALGGLLHAIATVTFGVNHIVSGVAINILALGVTRYLGQARVRGGSRRGGAPSSPRRSTRWAASPCPGLSDGLDTLESQHWFFGLRPRGPARRPGHRRLLADRDRGRAASRPPGGCCGAPPSACGCGPAARTRSPPSRSASTSTSTSTSP